MTLQRKRIIAGKRVRRKLGHTFEPRAIILSGVLGVELSGVRTVWVPGRDGYAYVRLMGREDKLVEAICTIVGGYYDLMVDVQEVKRFGLERSYEVIGPTSRGVGKPPPAPYIPPPNINVTLEDLRVEPLETPAMRVRVRAAQGCITFRTGETYKWGTTNSPTFTAPGAGLSRVDLVYVYLAAGGPAVGVATGTTFGVAASQDWPPPNPCPAWVDPAGLVRVNDTTTAITATLIRPYTAYVNYNADWHCVLGRSLYNVCCLR